MKLDRKEILKALETISVAGEGNNMVESGAVQNVMTFGDEVVVDLVLSTPALHIKKRAEVDVMKAIHEKVYEKVLSSLLKDFWLLFLQKYSIYYLAILPV